ncbi:MAG: pantoate--beta-alanine ligase [Bacteroidia bacterium]|nr:pantoate--beta-alanine ligase [Bacteroidia bacterium]MDW8301706.1 pantoate--beta-alanine ligase [Bacteroidia bacterium]
MEIFTRISEIMNYLHVKKIIGHEIGFVPTMGALHDGHLTLIKASKSKNLLTVASIFVNPTQFGPNEDFDKYPRTIEQDIALLKSVNCDVLFLPSVEEMYPTPSAIVLSMPSLTQKYEGKFRKGHFEGVMLIVAKLFNIILPDVAFFGQKDFQQCAVIKQMVKDLSFPIKIEIIPTVREKDGLAMSSRNRYLNEVERQKAVGIYQTLVYIKNMVQHEKNVDNLVKHAYDYIQKFGFTQIDYIDIVHADTLENLQHAHAENKPVMLITARLGTTRLLDNMYLYDMN